MRTIPTREQRFVEALEARIAPASLVGGGDPNDAVVAGIFVADLSITKTDNMTSAAPGSSAQYIIVVGNAGPDSAPGVDINDSFPASFTNASWTATVTGGATVPSASGNGNIATESGAFLPSGSSITYTVNGTISPSATGTMTNTATVNSGSIFDNNPGNNSATDNTTIVSGTVSVATSPTAVAETDAGGKIYTFTRDGDNTQPLTINFSAGGSASFTNDYTLTGADAFSNQTGVGTLTFAAASSTATVTLTPNNDTLVEGDESASLFVNTGAGYTVGSSPATGTITDNDSATFSFVTATSTAPEANSPHLVGVQLTTIGNGVAGAGSLQDGFSVSVTDLGGGTATGSGVDYTFSQQSLFFNAGDTGSTQNVSASIVNDSISEGNETFNLGLSVGPPIIFAPAEGGVFGVAEAGGVTVDNSPHTVTIVDNDVDLTVTVSGPSTNVVAGSGAGNLSYTVTLTNSGSTTATNVDVFADFMTPSGVSFVSGTPSSGGTFMGNTWTVPSLAPTATATITFVLTADASVVNNASATTSASISDSDETRVNTEDDSAFAGATIVRQSDLAITKSDSPDPVAPGTQLTYTIVVENNGPSDNTSATITDMFPVAVTGVTWTASYTPGSTGNINGAGNINEAVSVRSGGSVTYTVTGIVAAPSNTVISNTASLTSDEDTNLANNSDTETTLVLVGGVNLSVTKENVNNDEVVVPGETVTYTINYANNGPQNAPGVVLTETLPAGTTFIATGSTPGWTQVGATNQYTLTIGTLTGLAAGAPPENGGPAPVNSGTATFVVGVINTAPAGLNSIDNTTTISYDNSQGADLNSEDNTATDTDTLNAAPDLRITKTSPVVSVPRGFALTYTITYGNSGTQDATNVQLRETVPAGMTFNAANSPGWTLAEDASGDYVFVVGNVPAGAGSGTVPFGVTVNEFGPNQFVNTATIGDGGANGADVNSENNTTSLTVPIYEGIYVVSTGKKLPGETNVTPRVRVYDIATDTEVHDFLAYEANSTASVFTAVGDFNDDGFDDIVTSIGKGSGRVRLWDGLTGERMNIGAQTELAPFNAKTGRGGVVAVGDLTGDGTPDIIIADGYLGRNVKTFNGDTGSLMRSFNPLGPNARGVHVASADFDGDGRDDLVASRGDGTRVRVFSGINFDSAPAPTMLLDLKLAKGTAFGIAAGDVNGDGRADLIFGSGPNRASAISIYSTITNTVSAPISLGGPDRQAGVSVAAVDVDFDGVAEILATVGPALGGRVRFFESTGVEDTTHDFQPFPERAGTVLFVSGSRPVPFLV